MHSPRPEGAQLVVSEPLGALHRRTWPEVADRSIAVVARGEVPVVHSVVGAGIRQGEHRNNRPMSARAPEDPAAEPASERRTHLTLEGALEDFS